MKGAILGFVISFCLIIGSLAGSLLYTGLSIQASQHRWCQTLNLLTQNQPPKGGGTANPSRLFAEKFSSDITQLRKDYQC